MIFVTGGTGFLGAHLIFELLCRKKKVRALKRPNASLGLIKKIFSYYTHDSANLLSKIEWVDGDVLDYLRLQEVTEGVDCIFHCAAKVSFNPRDKKEMLVINERGTENIVNIALEKKINALGYVSSISTLGRAETDGEIINEQTFWKDSSKNSVYSKSKFLAEKQVWRGIAEGLNAVIINPSVIIGPGNWRSDSSSIINYVAKGNLFYTNGVNGFVYVRDVVNALLLLVDQGCYGENFIVSSENLTYKELFFMIAKELNCKPPSFNAGSTLSGIAWRLEWLKSLITNKPPLITRETANTANQIYRYSSDKLLHTTNIRLHSIENAIAIICNNYLR